MLAKIKTDRQRDFDVVLSYYRSWKGKGLELEEINENWEEAYSILPSYTVQL